MNPILLIFPAIFVPCMAGKPHFFKPIDASIAENPYSFTNKDYKGDVFLHKMVKSGSVKLGNLKKVAESKLGLNDQNDMGNTALHEAVLRKRLDIVKILVEAGADISLRNKKINGNSICSKNTPLHLAAIKDLPKIAEKLLRHGAPADALNEESENFRYTPMQLAAEHGSIGVVQVLLDFKAKIEGPESASSALHVSVSFHRRDITRLLLDNGANPNARATNSYLYRSVIEEAVELVDVNVLEMLIDNGGKANESNPSRENVSPLHLFMWARAWPVWKGIGAHLPDFKRMLKLLMKAGADPCAQNIHGFTPVQFAIFHYSPIANIFFEEITEELVNRNEGPWAKSLDIMGYKDKTALDLAISMPELESTKGTDVSEGSILMASVSHYAGSADKAAAMSKATASLIRFQSHRLGKNFKLTEDVAEKAMRALMNYSFDTLYKAWIRKGVFKFYKFFLVAMDEWKELKQLKYPKSDNKYDYIRLVFVAYKEIDIYPFYVALKAYYPIYYKEMAPRIKGDDDASMIKKGQLEVKNFEEVEICTNKNEFIRILRFMENIIGERTFIEEETVILAVMKIEFSFNSGDVAKALLGL